MPSAQAVASSEQPAHLRARALVAACVLTRIQGDHEQAKAFVEEGLALYRELDHSEGIADALSKLATVAVNEREYERASSLYEESIGLSRTLDDKWALAISLNNLGNLALTRSQHERAIALFEESLALHSGLGDVRNVGISLVWTPCPRSAGCQNYNRPLFNVADNGSFLTRLLR